METPKIFESEYRFCLILWANEPIHSRRLAELCQQKLGWSRPTTYTVIRRLAERGVLVSENAIVRSLISKEEAQSSRLEELMDTTFEGSMPAFLAAFSKNRRIGREEARQLRALIDQFEAEEEEP